MATLKWIKRFDKTKQHRRNEKHERCIRLRVEWSNKSQIRRRICFVSYVHFICSIPSIPSIKGRKCDRLSVKYYILFKCTLHTQTHVGWTHTDFHSQSDQSGCPSNPNIFALFQNASVERPRICTFVATLNGCRSGRCICTICTICRYKINARICHHKMAFKK